jgi:hypothetical protein
MPQSDDGILAGDEGSYSNRAPDSVPFSGCLSPHARLRSRTLSTIRRGRRIGFISIGIIHAVLGLLALLCLPVFCSGTLFFLFMTEPMPGAPPEEVRGHDVVATALWLEVILNAVFVLTLPLGIGIILRRRWGLWGTYILSATVALLLATLLISAVTIPHVAREQEVLLHYFLFPTLIHVGSSVALWYLARHGV